MIPDLHPLAWLLYALSALLVAVFGFWLVRPQRLAETDGPRSVASSRGTRGVAAVMLLCSIASGTTLLGFGDGHALPLGVGMVAAASVGIGVGLTSARRSCA